MTIKEINPIYAPPAAELHLDGMPPRLVHIVNKIVQNIYEQFERQKVPRPSISVVWFRNSVFGSVTRRLVITLKVGTLGMRLVVTGELLDIAEGSIIFDQISRMARRMKLATRRKSDGSEGMDGGLAI